MATSEPCAIWAQQNDAGTGFLDSCGTALTPVHREHVKA